MKRVVWSLSLIIFILSINAVQSLVQNRNTISTYGTIGNSENKFWWGAVVSNTGWGEDYWGSFFNKTQINILKQSGATSVRIMLDKHAWYYNVIGSTSNVLDLPYKDYIKQLVLWCKPELKVCLDLTRDSSKGDGFDTDQSKAMVIQTPALREAWIKWGKEVISYCNPDAIGLMNEPRGEVIFDYYYDNFVIPSINAYRSVDSNINIFVMGMPFYDLSGFIRRPINDDKVFYQFHVYYKYPISLSETSQDYYSLVNNYAIGNLATAKSQLFEYLDNFKFASLPRNRINIAECGIYGMALGQKTPSTPNWDAFMLDLYDYTKENKLHGLFQYAINSGYYLMLDPATNYKTLTPYGGLWAQNCPVYSS